MKSDRKPSPPKSAPEAIPMANESKVFTFDFGGIGLVSISLVENNGEIDIRAYTDVGLSFSGTFDPKKTYWKQGAQRWPAPTSLNLRNEKQDTSAT